MQNAVSDDRQWLSLDMMVRASLLDAARSPKQAREVLDGLGDFQIDRIGVLLDRIRAVGLAKQSRPAAQ
jgi:hypothetical protein